MNKFNDLSARTPPVEHHNKDVASALRVSTCESAFLDPLDEIELGHLLKAPGIDDIPALEIRGTFMVMKSVILFIFNGIISSGVFPSEFGCCPTSQSWLWETCFPMSVFRLRNKDYS